MERKGRLIVLESNNWMHYHCNADMYLLCRIYVHVHVYVCACDDYYVLSSLPSIAYSVCNFVVRNMCIIIFFNRWFRRKCWVIRWWFLLLLDFWYKFKLCSLYILYIKCALTTKLMKITTINLYDSSYITASFILISATCPHSPHI